jgi:hypothetical protein
LVLLLATSAGAGAGAGAGAEKLVLLAVLLLVTSAYDDGTLAKRTTTTAIATFVIAADVVRPRRVSILPAAAITEEAV